jgi:hypothetical protein
MFQEALQQCRHVATICDALYQEWAAEVAALPPRKQKKWSSWVMDKHGCRITVRYAPQEAGLGVHTLFEERLTAQSAADRGLPTGTWIPVQSVSQRAEKAARMKENGEELLVADIASRSFVQPTLDNAEHVALAWADAAAAHTGNHRPNVRAVRVPTAPGQPVRG